MSQSRAQVRDEAGPSESRSYLLRRSFREDGKVRHETLANLSALRPRRWRRCARCWRERRSSSRTRVRALAGSSPRHVAAVAAQAKALGFPELFGSCVQERDIAYALVLSRVVRPKPKLATLSWWKDTTLCEDLHLEGVSTDEAYAAMDWLYERPGHDRAGARTPAPLGLQQPVGASVFRPLLVVDGGADLSARVLRLLTPTKREESPRSSTAS